MLPLLHHKNITKNELMFYSNMEEVINLREAQVVQNKLIFQTFIP